MDEVEKWLARYREATHLDTKLEAVEHLATYIVPKLHRYLRAFCPRDAVDDVLQEALIGMTRSLARFKSDAPAFDHWCFRIARNKLANYFEANRPRNIEFVDIDELSELLEAANQTNPLTMEDMERLQFALRIVTEAKPPCRHYLTQRFVYGLEYKEIARRFGQSVAAVRGRLDRCIKLAKELVSAKGETYA